MFIKKYISIIFNENKYDHWKINRAHKKHRFILRSELHPSFLLLRWSRDIDELLNKWQVHNFYFIENEVKVHHPFIT